MPPAHRPSPRTQPGSGPCPGRPIPSRPPTSAATAPGTPRSCPGPRPARRPARTPVPSARGPAAGGQIGRASCRERVEIPGGAGAVRRKKEHQLQSGNKGGRIDGAEGEVTVFFFKQKTAYELDG